MSTKPRTKLPFLRQVVQQAKLLPNTDGTATPFKLYPALKPNTTKQEVKEVLYKDASCIIVNDAYPKSTVHCLVLPLDPKLDCLDALSFSSSKKRPRSPATKRTRLVSADTSSDRSSESDEVENHLALLRHFVDVANRYIAFLKVNQPALCGKLRFITGFHAIPSLPTLHMHVISMDLVSPCLKNSKHYNSFATNFFLPSEKVIADLEAHGKVTINQDVEELHRLEGSPPQCLWCGARCANMPALKDHIQKCKQNASVEV